MGAPTDSCEQCKVLTGDCHQVLPDVLALASGLGVSAFLVLSCVMKGKSQEEDTSVAEEFRPLAHEGA
jgi:hypothetical protein